MHRLECENSIFMAFRGFGHQISCRTWLEGSAGSHGAWRLRYIRDPFSINGMPALVTTGRRPVHKHVEARLDPLHPYKEALSHISTVLSFQGSRNVSCIDKVSACFLT